MPGEGAPRSWGESLSFPVTRFLLVSRKMASASWCFGIFVGTVGGGCLLCGPGPALDRPWTSPGPALDQRGGSAVSGRHRRLMVVAASSGADAARRWPGSLAVRAVLYSPLGHSSPAKDAPPRSSHRGSRGFETQYENVFKGTFEELGVGACPLHFQALTFSKSRV